MTADSNRLDLIKPGIALVIFIILIGVGIFFLNNLDQQRKSEVYKKYAEETESYISQNQPALVSLFNQTSGKTSCSQYSPIPDCLPAAPIKELIDRQLTHNLKDWSSTLFITSSGTTESMKSISLSGDMVQFHGYRQESTIKVWKLLSGEVSELPWDDYTYTFPGKEVVMPVKDDSGKVVGLIVRGVIEEKSF